MMKRMISAVGKDIRDAKWAVIIITAYFALGKFWLHSICPVVTLTGYPCPACGLTRAGICVLRSQFTEAFSIQPFIYPVLVLAGWFCVRRYMLGKRMGELLKWSAVIVMAGMVLFYIWRMAHEFPGDPPMSYYDGSLFGQLMRSITLAFSN